MWLVVAALLTSLSASSHAAGLPAVTTGSTAATTGPVGLDLLAPVKCETTQDVQRCLVARPKEWSPAEHEAMTEALQRLASNELVRGILVGLRDNGYAGLRRYATATKRDPVQGRVAMFSPGFVLYIAKDIGITDAFFQTQSVTDPISGYRYGDLILLHELVHAYDDGKVSSREEFTSVTGWWYGDSRWKYGNPVDVPSYRTVFAQTLMSYARGEYRDAWSRDRYFATAMTVPLPTIQSLVSPDESFADILAHLILDERAATYLKPAVVEWFEEEVFPALREKAQRFATLEQQ
jgi:hypothetical protein